MDFPSEDDLRQLVGRQAALLALLEREFGSRPLVLPNGRFFPDRFERSRDGVSRLLARMQHHAGVSDIPIEVLVDSDAASGASCSSGACSPVAASDEPRLSLSNDQWTFRLNASELGHPVVLTTILARGLATIFLEETRPDGVAVPEPIPITTDLAAVELGLGALLMEGSYIYQKSCGGPSIASLTALSTSEIAVSTALFADHTGQDLGKALSSMGATQRSALSQARRWAKANRHLGKALAQNPASLLRGDYRLKEASAGLMSFFFPKRTDEDELEQALLLGPGRASELAPIVPGDSPPKARSADDEELAALVESSLAELRGS